MAESSPLSATGSLTEYEYEWLAAPTQADGLIGHPDDTPPVSVVGGQAIVRAGLRGTLRGFPWASGSVDIPYSPSLAGGTRYDVIVLRLDRAAGSEVGTDLRGGTAGAGVPALVTGTGPADLYEIPLAELKISGGVLTLHRLAAWYLGDDGQILCESTARPPHRPGRVAWETDTGRVILSTGTEWLVVREDTGNVGVALANGWYASVTRTRRVNGWVHVNLRVGRNGTGLAAGAPSLICTLPDGFRPAGGVEQVAAGRMVSSTSGGVGVVAISPTGGVTLVSHPGFSSTSVFHVTTTYPA